ncbi:MAG: DNA repair protein RecN [Flavobacteriaceae bacterium]|nr:DNA repair protein RecN [Flavobacteriaceae bacterium]
MLKSLVIKNYALIEDLQVNFNNGLSIITGETGAGKSILLGGLSLVLGKRADLSQIKDASKKCVIEATFEIAKYSLKPLFEQNDLDYEVETIVRREILPSGKSRAFVNDSPVNLNALLALGEQLIDIHSQHQTLELTNNNFQFQIIDALANNDNRLLEYSNLLKAYKSLKNDLEKLNNQKAEAIKEHDYNAFLLNELVEANLVEGELESLEAEYETLNNIEEIQQELSFSTQLLSDENIGIVQALTNLKTSLSKISDLTPTYKELFSRVNSMLIEADDLYTEVYNAQESLEANPQRLEVVNTKLQTIHNLFLKHSSEHIVDLLNIKSDLDKKVAVVFNIDDDIGEVEKKISHLKSKLNRISKEIHDKRIEAVPVLKNKLESILSELGMEHAKFKIELKLEDTFLENGRDTLDFLFTANKGGGFNTLKKVASGGELSRIMLAIKSVLSNYMHLPTIMFDEIDSGVSGDISNKIAVIMQSMSKHMQVFTITHSPQIAAKGDVHFKVFKENEKDQTITQIIRLNNDERIIEIAQMLGGKQTSASAIAHAKQLMN